MKKTEKDYELERLKRENYYLTLALENEWSNYRPDILKKKIEAAKNGDI